MRTLLFDFSRVLLFPKDQSHKGNLNKLHRILSTNPRYNPLEHFVLNTDLLAHLESIKEKFNLYIFTSETIQEHPAFAPYLTIFKEIFSAAGLGVTKRQPAAYSLIAGRIGTAPNEITFIDDHKENVDAAMAAGMGGIVYVSNTQLLNRLSNL